MKRITGLLLTIALVFTMLPAMVSADSSNPLWDVEQGKWYYKDIHEVYARGMIQGVEEYGKVSFKPNDPVTQIQGLIMVLRYLDLEGNVKNLSASDVSTRLSQIGIDESQVPSWARAHVAYAISLGYVKSKNDALDIKASRAWISQLLVRVLEKEAQALSPQMTGQTSFADDSAIPSNLKGYVNTVVSLELMKGSAENGALKFNPAGTTTRAEMATILKRLDNHRTVPSNYSKEVVIKELTETGIEFQNEDGRFETLKMKNPMIFQYNEKRMLRDLNKYDKARIAVRNNEIVFIDVTGKGELKENVVFGKFEKMDTSLKLIWVIADGESIDPLRYSDPLVIKDEQNRTLDLTELKKGKEVKVYVGDNQMVREIIIPSAIDTSTTPTATESVVGTFLSIDEGNHWITVEIDTGAVKTYTYDSQTYVKHQEARFPKVSDLRKGDRVRLYLSTTVTQIEVLALAEDNVSLSGTIVSLSEKLSTITVKLDSHVEAYLISPQVMISIDGAINPTLAQLKEGHNVKLELSNRQVTKITVVGDSYLQEVKGRFIGVDPRTGILNFRAENGELVAKELGDKPYIEMEGYSRSLTDLQKDMRVILTLKDNKVTQIVLDNKRQGVIKSINTTTRKVVVAHEDKDLEYTMLAGVPVDLFGVASAKMTDLAVGHEIQFYLNTDDEIKSIVVSQTLDYMVISIDTTKKTLNVIRNAVPSVLSYNDKVQLVIPGKTNPTWAELKAQPIRATFFGKQLNRVEKK